MIAVTYEQACGLRDKHEKPQGFEISVSRTIDAPIEPQNESSNLL